MKFFDAIRSLVAKGDLESAIAQLEALSKTDKNHRDDLFLISSRFQKLRSDLRRGTISESSAELKLSSLTRSVLDLLNAMEEEMPSFRFTFPLDGEKVRDSVISIKGELEKNPPNDNKFWILQEINGIYHHTDRPIELDFAAGTWKQENINFGVNGLWHLTTCQVSPATEALFKSNVANNDWSGFRELPDGIIKLNTITIEKV